MLKVSLTLAQTHSQKISPVVVPMPWPALPHQLPLLLPFVAICVVVPRGARSSLASSSLHMTSDTPSDPAGPLLGCSPWTLTTQAPLRHLSPIRKPCLFDTEQLGLGPLWPLSRGKMKMEWRVGKEEEDIKSSTQCEIHPSALGGCRLAVCPGQGRSVGVQYLQRNIQRINAELCPFPQLQLLFFICKKESFRNCAEIEWLDDASYIRQEWALNIRNDQNAFCLLQLSARA